MHRQEGGHSRSSAAVKVEHGRDATLSHSLLSGLYALPCGHSTHPSLFSLFLVHGRDPEAPPELLPVAEEVRDIAAVDRSFPSNCYSPHRLPRVSAVDPRLCRAFPGPLGESPIITVPPARRRRQFLVAAVAFDRGPLDPDPTAA